MALTHDTVTELLNATLPEIQYGSPPFEATNLQEYLAIDRLWNLGLEWSGQGPYFRFPVLLDFPDVAEYVDLDTPLVAKFGHEATDAHIPHKYFQSSYAYYEEIIASNNGPNEIYNYLEAQRNGAWLKNYEKLERTAWGLTPATDTQQPLGIFNFITYNGTAGFNGTNPTGYSDVIGISNTKWANYTDSYTDVSADDLLYKLVKSKMRTYFKAPQRIQTPQLYTYDRREYYVNLATYLGLKQLYETRVDGPLSLDLNPQGDPTVGGIPVRWVPAFDGEFGFGSTIASGSDPVLQVDWSVMGWVFLKGFKMSEKPIVNPSTNPNQFIVPIKSVHNMFCKCRRPLALIAKSDPNA